MIHHDNYLLTRNYDYILDIQTEPSDKSTLFCNDILLYKKIFRSVSSVLDLDPIRVQYSSITSLLSMLSKDDNRILVLTLGISNNDKKSFNKMYKTFYSLSKIISWIKRINVNDILQHYDRKTCIINGCRNEIEKYNLCNLPICHYHTMILNGYKIADSIGNDKFDYSEFVSNSHYRKSFLYVNEPKKIKCKLCNRTVNVNTGLSVCNGCLNRAKRIIIYDLLLGLTTIKELENLKNRATYWDKKIPKDSNKKGTCPDCGEPVSKRYTFCKVCESRYDWDRVETALDNNEFSWNDFCTSYSLRLRYRVMIEEPEPDDNREEESPQGTGWRLVSDAVYSNYTTPSSDNTSDTE